MKMSHNINLSILSRFAFNRSVATGSVYGTDYVDVSINDISLLRTLFGPHLLDTFNHCS